MYNGKHFRPEWFTKSMQGENIVKWDWISYSINEDKKYCMECMIMEEKNIWNIDDLNSLEKITSKIITHETSY